MAANGRSHREPAAAAAPELNDSGPPYPQATFAIAAILTAVWLLALIGLAAGTANPVTLNRHQIETADLVVTGRVVDLDRGEVAVEQVWKGGAPAEQIRVANLAGTPAAPGGVYLIPLSTTENGFVVTVARRRRDMQNAAADPARDSAGPLLIYPATAEALEQLQQALGRPGD